MSNRVQPFVAPAEQSTSPRSQALGVMACSASNSPVGQDGEDAEAPISTDSALQLAAALRQGPGQGRRGADVGLHHNHIRVACQPSAGRDAVGGYIPGYVFPAFAAAAAATATAAQAQADDPRRVPTDELDRLDGILFDPNGRNRSAAAAQPKSRGSRRVLGSGPGPVACDPNSNNRFLVHALGLPGLVPVNDDSEQPEEGEREVMGSNGAVSVFFSPNPVEADPHSPRSPMNDGVAGSFSPTVAARLEPIMALAVPAAGHEAPQAAVLPAADPAQAASAQPVQASQNSASGFSLADGAAGTSLRTIPATLLISAKHDDRLQAVAGRRAGAAQTGRVVQSKGCCCQ